jgi:hypothetical protein
MDVLIREIQAFQMDRSKITVCRNGAVFGRTTIA